MSKPTKLRGGSRSELTRFKELWINTLTESAKESLRSLFVSPQTQAQTRAYIQQAHGIKLHRDDQLNAFRDWELDQRAMDLEAERATEEERRLVLEHPDWTKDQVREDLLKRFYFRARARGDEKLGLATMREDRGLIQALTGRDQFELMAAEKMLSGELRKRAEEINNSNLSNAEKIAAMRKAAFADVDELQRSGKVQIPK